MISLTIGGGAAEFIMDGCITNKKVSFALEHFSSIALIKIWSIWYPEF